MASPLADDEWDRPGTIGEDLDSPPEPSGPTEADWRLQALVGALAILVLGAGYWLWSGANAAADAVRAELQEGLAQGTTGQAALPVLSLLPNPRSSSPATTAPRIEKIVYNRELALVRLVSTITEFDGVAVSSRRTHFFQHSPERGWIPVEARADYWGTRTSADDYVFPISVDHDSGLWARKGTEREAP